MGKLHNFTIYVPTLSVTVLSILSTLVVCGVAICYMLPTFLWLFNLGISHPVPYITTGIESTQVRDWVEYKKGG